MKCSWIVLCFFDFYLLNKNIHVEAKCEIDIKNLGPNSPLILDETGRKFVYPKIGNTYIELERRENLYLSCTGPKNTFENEIFKNVELTCINGTKFLSRMDQSIAFFEDLNCENYPKSVVRKVRKNQKKYKYCTESVYEIGFELKNLNNEFLKIIDICHDDKLRHTMISHIEIVPVLENSQKKKNDTFFFSDFGFDFEVNDYYKQKSQRKSFARIFGPEMAAKYINEESYLQRGHLAARAYLFYTSQQKGTFYFFNVVPQWSTINMGNWANIERKIRFYSKVNQNHVHVYVGSTKILKLNSDDTKKRQVYLYDRNQMIPVPQILFTLVYDEFKKSAIVILAINNPYIRKLDRENYICEDICDEIGFTFRTRENFTKGYSYCCSYKNAKNVIPFLPELKVRNLMYFGGKINRTRKNYII